MRHRWHRFVRNLAQRRGLDYLGFITAGATMSLLVVGCVQHLLAQASDLLSQPQVAINAAMIERVGDVVRRLGRVEDMVQYALIGIVGNLITCAVVLYQQANKRRG